MKKIVRFLLLCSIILLPLSEVSADTLVPDAELDETYILITYNLKVVLGDTVVIKVTSKDYSIYVNVAYQSSDDDKCASSPCWVSIGSVSVLNPNKSKTFYVESEDLIDGFISNLKNQFTGIDVTFRALVKATASTTSVLEEVPFKVNISPSSARSGLAYSTVAFTGLIGILGFLYFYRKRQNRRR
jgi:hypothetical protein